MTDAGTMQAMKLCKSTCTEISMARRRLESLGIAAEHIKNDIGGGADCCAGIAAMQAMLAARISTLSREIEALVLRYDGLCARLDAAWGGVCEEHKNVLRLRYQLALSWRDVSKNSGYSESHCLRINREYMRRAAGDGM